MEEKMQQGFFNVKVAKHTVIIIQFHISSFEKATGGEPIFELKPEKEFHNHLYAK